VLDFELFRAPDKTRNSLSMRTRKQIKKCRVSQESDRRSDAPVLPDHSFCIKVKVEVKITPEQATKAQRGSRGIALLFLYPRR
jgi:uncharacterized OsmC-like protein